MLELSKVTEKEINAAVRNSQGYEPEIVWFGFNQAGTFTDMWIPSANTDEVYYVKFWKEAGTLKASCDCKWHHERAGFCKHLYLGGKLVKEELAKRAEEARVLLAIGDRVKYLYGNGQVLEAHVWDIRRGKVELFVFLPGEFGTAIKYEPIETVLAWQNDRLVYGQYYNKN